MRIVYLAFLLLIFTSCGQKIGSAEIIGKWRIYDVEADMPSLDKQEIRSYEILPIGKSHEFLKKGVYRYQTRLEEGIGKWKLEKNMLQLDYQRSSPVKSDLWQQSRFEFVSLVQDTLVWVEHYDFGSLTYYLEKITSSKVESPEI
ncbi:MAG: hypothetical protein EP338_05930 [Bacteroidetes bacterium]|nr:MAG: hypothetical protein EP338_05930 [Bacteroidota bacterium]